MSRKVKVWAGKALLALALLVSVAGLATSMYWSTYRSTGDSSEKAGSDYILTSEDFPAASAEVGNQVGDRVPDFALELADGTTVTSASLVAEGRPTFLFFWATI